MKKNVHPECRDVVFQDVSTNQGFLTRSTLKSGKTIKWTDGVEYPLVRMEITSYSHPIWTGQQRVVDTAGRIERFKKKYERNQPKK